MNTVRIAGQEVPVASLPLIWFIDVLTWLVEEQQGCVTFEEMKDYMAFEMYLEAVPAVAILTVMLKSRFILPVKADRWLMLVTDAGHAVHAGIMAELTHYRTPNIAAAERVINAGKLPQAQRLKRFSYHRRLNDWVEQRSGERYYCTFCKASIHVNDPDHDEICRGF